MPVPTAKPPEKLRPYLFHGVELAWADGDNNAMADCPLCGRTAKFGVKISTGEYYCFKCGEKGNATVFLRWLWDASDKATTPDQYSQLAEDRSLLRTDCLMHWGVVHSVATNDWLVPGYNASGKLCQLYRYLHTAKGARLLPTPTMGHQLHGANLYSASKPLVYVCEGPWDALALWEALSMAKSTTDDERLAPTANLNASLLAQANVLAVPGCNTFAKAWLPLFADKVVVLMYDNDHPRTHPTTGKDVAPAGYAAVQRVAGLLSAARNPPQEINYLRWGEAGYDPDLPSGTDVRDLLNA